MTQPIRIGKEHNIIKIHCLLLLSTFPYTGDDSYHLHKFSEQFSQPYPWFFHEVCFRKLEHRCFKIIKQWNKVIKKRSVSCFKNSKKSNIWPKKYQKHHLSWEKLFFFMSKWNAPLTYVKVSKMLTAEFRFLWVRMVIWKRQAKPHAGENTEQLELTYAHGRSSNRKTLC